MHGEGVEHAERRGNAGVLVHVTIGAQHGGGPGEGVRGDGVVVVGLVGVVDPHAQAREHVAEQAIDSLRHLPGPLPATRFVAPLCRARHAGCRVVSPL